MAKPVEEKSMERECPHCRGEVVQRTERVFDSRDGLPICGPGSEMQWKVEITYYCKTCRTLFVDVNFS